jgi:hypothetical protein
VYKVKTFGMELLPFKTARELSELDTAVNEFLSGRQLKRVISVSDTATTDDKGETIGLIRTVCYEE